jgi:hypothetical protein
MSRNVGQKVFPVVNGGQQYGRKIVIYMIEVNCLKLLRTLNCLSWIVRHLYVVLLLKAFINTLTDGDRVHNLVLHSTDVLHLQFIIIF